MPKLVDIWHFYINLINVPLVVNKFSNPLKNKSICDGIIYHGILFQNTPYELCIVHHGYYYSKFFSKGLLKVSY